MDKTKTLIILTPGFPENENDSTCLPPQQVFLNSLKQTNPDLNIIVLAFQYPFIFSDYIWNGIRLISFNGRNGGKISRLIIWIKVWRKLKKIKKENEIIGLLSFWLGECALIGKYFAKKYNLKYYCWILGQDARKKNRYIRLMGLRPEELIAMSDFLAKEFYGNYGFKPKHIITNGIDIRLYSTNLNERYIDILGVGSLIPLKQYDLFIEIINEVKQAFPSVKVLLCGKGPEENYLKAVVEKLGLHNNISLTGEKSHTEVLQLMQQTKIFLHPSFYEGFSTVLLEALYAGAHVISFIKPMEESFKHHYVVNNRQEMTNKILEILRDQKRDHDPVLPYPIQGVTEKIMRLFTR